MTNPNTEQTGTSAQMLEACPFCRGAVQFRKALHISEGNTDAIIHVARTNCGMLQFEDGSIDESIIAKWNTRTAASQDAREAVDNHHPVRSTLRKLEVDLRACAVALGEGDDLGAVLVGYADAATAALARAASQDARPRADAVAADAWPASARQALKECASRCRYDGDLFHDQGNYERRDASWKAGDMAGAVLAALTDAAALARAASQDAREALKPFAEIALFVEHTDQRDGEIVHRQYDREGKRVGIPHDLYLTIEPHQVVPDFDTAARALGFSQLETGKWFFQTATPGVHMDHEVFFDSAEQIFDWWGKASGNAASQDAREAAIRLMQDIATDDAHGRYGRLAREAIASLAALPQSAPLFKASQHAERLPHGDTVGGGADAVALAGKIETIDRLLAREEYDADSAALLLMRDIWDDLKSTALAAPQSQAGASEPVAKMTFEIIEAAFKEYRKTLTVMDKPANFDSFSQGYVAGWNAHEAVTPSPTAAGRTECGCMDECLHKPDCVFERDPQESAPK